jgi:hypothetical protein
VNQFSLAALLAASLCLGAMPASAQQNPSPFGAPLQAGQLAALRGGASNTNTTDGVLRDTSASQLVTGANSVNQGSFANASGLPTVIQNSGNNVLIQASTIVNVQFVQP